MSATESLTAPTSATQFHQDVHQGLMRRPRMIPPKYFYDARGSNLFDRICELPEYYVTRTELGIMTAEAAAMAAAIGPNALLIEPGSGSGVKVRLLLDQLPDPAGYVPVEICREHLTASAEALRAAYPGLEVLPVCADFTQPFAVPEPPRQARRRVVYFPGSTIGNFPPADALALLRTFHAVAGEGGLLLLGIDLRKSAGVLVPAYDDSAGVTADFNRNLLHRINRELGADFEPEQFRHRAIWNEHHGRIEMHLVSEQDQSVRLGDTDFRFPAGDHIVTEYSYKHTRASLHTLAAQAGFRPLASWQDEAEHFSVELLHRN